ncbi:MAG: chorismate synthase [Bacteroidales bacterium]|jgi:chorismate synthase|nr:chorismate synthase [Bacteroidales bacterium]
MNSLGRIFKINIFGESHGDSLGILIDGCPAGLELDMKDFMPDLSRRKSGDIGTTPRIENDMPNIISGILKKHTTGAPINILFENNNTRSDNYSKLRDIPRPGHADFTGKQKFGSYNDYRGGGHFSGRLTLGLVAAGVIAKKILDNITIDAKITELGGESDYSDLLNKMINEKDSIGGIIECTVKNIPTGLGEPFFDSVESLISHSIFSIPGIKGIEFGAGFKSAAMKGSECNDRINDINGTTETNNSGGINGGITNGNNIVFRVAVKPTSSIGKEQKTINIKTKQIDSLKIQGRHDACIALRMPVIVEAIAAIVLTDLMMLENKINRVIS